MGRVIPSSDFSVGWGRGRIEFEICAKNCESK